VEFFINRFLPLTERNYVFCEVGWKLYSIIWVSECQSPLVSEATDGRSLIAVAHVRCQIIIIFRHLG